MGVDSSISSKFLLRLVIGILTILSLEDWVASASLNDKFCKDSECGDVMKGCSIWSDTEPCPNPSFENECRDKPLLNLRPFGEDVISYETNSLRLSSELKRPGNACFALTLPSEFQTPVSSIEPPSSLGFNWKPSHLAFLHNCSSFPNYSNPHSPCPFDSANRSYVALIIGREEDLHLDLSVCKSHVIVPVKLASPDSEEIGNDDYEEKLKHGFRLQWNLTSWKSCVDCQKSGGKCRGLDGHFQCLYSGKDYPPPYKRGNIFRLIHRNSNRSNSRMCFSANVLAMLSKLEKDFKGRGRALWLSPGFLFSVPFSHLGFIHQAITFLFTFLSNNLLEI